MRWVFWLCGLHKGKITFPPLRSATGFDPPEPPSPKASPPRAWCTLSENLIQVLVCFKDCVPKNNSIKPTTVEGQGLKRLRSCPLRAASEYGKLVWRTEAGAGEEQPHTALQCFPRFPACSRSHSAWGWDNLGPFSPFFSLANKNGLLLAEVRAQCPSKAEPPPGERGLPCSHSALLPPQPLSKGSHRTQCQKLASAGFVRGGTLRWQPTHKVPSMAAPPSCLFTFIPTRGIITIVCNISWKNESWAFCLPSAGRLCHISSSNARPPAPLPRIPAGPFVRGAGLRLAAPP